jgi:hypothetical protein
METGAKSNTDNQMQRDSQAAMWHNRNPHTPKRPKRIYQQSEQSKTKPKKAKSNPKLNLGSEIDQKDSWLREINTKNKKENIS